MKNFIGFLCFSFFLIASKSTKAAEGKELANACMACHGQSGVSMNDQWPNLAGQKKEYLVNQLRSFRSGERKNSLMNPMAQALSDEDIEKLATYFAGIK